MLEARNILDKGIGELKASIVANTDLVRILITDLENAKQRFRDREAYEHGGRAEIRGKALGHMNKRAENLDFYQNCCQKKMQTSSKSYFG